jgi:hypothetical protein
MHAISYGQVFSSSLRAVLDSVHSRLTPARQTSAKVKVLTLYPLLGPGLQRHDPLDILTLYPLLGPGLQRHDPLDILTLYPLLGPGLQRHDPLDILTLYSLLGQGLQGHDPLDILTLYPLLGQGLQGHDERRLSRSKAAPLDRPLPHHSGVHTLSRARAQTRPRGPPLAARAGTDRSNRPAGNGKCLLVYI